MLFTMLVKIKLYCIVLYYNTIIHITYEYTYCFRLSQTCLEQFISVHTQNPNNAYM